MSHEDARPESAVTDASILVLATEVKGIVSDISEIKSSLKILPDMLVRIGGIEKDVAAADQKSDSALQKIDAAETAISNIRENVGSSNKTWKVLGGLSVAFSTMFSGGVGIFLMQWHPWIEDINRAKDIRTVEIGALKDSLAKQQNQTDSRLAVLEFRANNLDGKASR
jgi:hypothetical protein